MLSIVGSEGSEGRGDEETYGEKTSFSICSEYGTLGKDRDIRRQVFESFAQGPFILTFPGNLLIINKATANV